MDDRQSHYAFAVKDDGPGIPAQFHDQIFKMFHTLRPRDQVEGSGMGLAMVRKNSKSLAGRWNSNLGRQRKLLSVHLAEAAARDQRRKSMTPSDSHYVSHYSTPVNLVLVEDGDGDERLSWRLSQEAQGATPFASYHIRPVNIVLVEDDDGDAKAVRRAFQKAKIANPFVRAVDGLDALDILRGANGKAKVASPYLLLVDLNMPRMGGSS